MHPEHARDDEQTRRENKNETKNIQIKLLKPNTRLFYFISTNGRWKGKPTLCAQQFVSLLLRAILYDAFLFSAVCRLFFFRSFVLS